MYAEHRTRVTVLILVLSSAIAILFSAKMICILFQRQLHMMATVATESSPPAGDRPEVVAAIVLGIVFGVLLIIAILVAVIFVMKYRIRKRSYDVQKDCTHADNQPIGSRGSCDAYKTKSAVANEDPSRVQVAKAKSCGNEKTEVANKDPNMDQTHSDRPVFGTNGNQDLIDESLSNESKQYATMQMENGSLGRDAHINGENSRPVTDAEQTHNARIKLPRLVNSEKIGRSKKGYLDNLFRKMKKTDPMYNNDISEDNKLKEEDRSSAEGELEFRTHGNTAINIGIAANDNSAETAIDRTESHKHEANDLTERTGNTRAGVDSSPGDDSCANTNSYFSKDYLDRMLDGLRREEMNNQTHTLPKRGLSSRVCVDEEMLEFYKTSFNYLSKGQPEKARQTPDDAFFKSLQATPNESDERRESLKRIDYDAHEEQ